MKQKHHLKLNNEEQRICSYKECKQFGCSHHGEHTKNEYCDEQCDHNPEAKCEVVKNMKNIVDASNKMIKDIKEEAERKIKILEKIRKS